MRARIRRELYRPHCKDARLERFFLVAFATVRGITTMRVMLRLRPVS